ncbi:MAG: hypothetical protein JWN40_2284 [Phycisphaerales bacterium]|nr:hypothetical protein [Phycisphaerales bacterium]
MKFIRLAACAVLATPLVLFAEQGAPRPSPRPGGGPPHSTTGRSDGASRERNKEDMELFREKMEKFCKDHAPQRWAAMGGDKNPMKFGGMYFRFRGLTVLEKQDKALYDIKVRQIEIDDEEYGLMKEIREARDKSNNTEIDRITARLRDLSKEYISSRINERTHRIASLENTIATEKSALASDQQNQAKLIKDRVEAILSDTPPPGRSRSRDGEGASTLPAPADGAPVIGNP